MGLLLHSLGSAYVMGTHSYCASRYATRSLGHGCAWNSVGSGIAISHDRRPVVEETNIFILQERRKKKVSTQQFCVWDARGIANQLFSQLCTTFIVCRLPCILALCLCLGIKNVNLAEGRNDLEKAMLQEKNPSFSDLARKTKIGFFLLFVGETTGITACASRKTLSSNNTSI